MEAIGYGCVNPQKKYDFWELPAKDIRLLEETKHIRHLGNFQKKTFGKVSARELRD